LPDSGGDETDRMDETWCLFDGEMLDDELYAAYGKFKPGVRILVLSDSCHSGTVTREMYYRAKPATGIDGATPRYRNMPREVASKVYRANKGFYDEIQAGVKRDAEKAEIAASVILISGCQDNQLSQDGDFNGLFTARLLEVWRDGKFKKPYSQFRRAIVDLMPPDQTPNYFVVGAADKAFAKQAPFTL
jgi:metacaspase-1